MNQKFKDFALVNIGIIIIVLGIHLFSIPNNFATGGVPGIAIVINYFFKTMTPAMLILFINMLLLVVGFVVLGKRFGVKTIYGTIVFSLEIWLLEKLVPMNRPFTDQPLLELIFAISMTGCGSAILFNLDASTGGMDIAAMILKKFTNMDIGKALLTCNLLTATSIFFVFDIRTGMFCLFGLGMRTFVIDSVIESINLCKYFTIVTAYPNEICDFIINELKHSATRTNSIGAFTHEEKTVILTACRRSQALRLRNKVKEIDASAFIFITNTSEIIGKGFRTV